MKHDLFFEEEVKLRSGQRPILLEFQVSPDLGDILVSSMEGLVWVLPGSKGKVRAAFRKGVFDKSEIYPEILQEVIKRSIAQQWGSVLSVDKITKKYILEAVTYVQGYGFLELGVVGNPLCEEKPRVVKLLSKISPQILWEDADWCPLNMVLFMPKDKTYLGTVGSSPDLFYVMAHNVARGLGIILCGK